MRIEFEIGAVDEQIEQPVREHDCAAIAMAAGHDETQQQ
jgi:hypothetical protein